MNTKVCATCGIEKNIDEFPTRKNRPCGIRPYCKKCNNEVTKKYKKDHPEYHKEYYRKNKDIYLKRNREYLRERKKKDPIFKAAFNYRKRISQFYKGKGRNKRTHELLGCTWEQLILHLEKQFVDGMTKDNYGEWHIDHIVPLSSAKTIEESEKLCHYTNLQPLWAEDNRIKSDKLNWTKNIVVHQEDH
jgi:hypothetical protein